MWSCNAIPQFWHPPPLFDEWGECGRVPVFKSSWVQTALHGIFQNMTVQCASTVFASTTSFFTADESLLEYMVWQVFQLRWCLTQFLKMSQCNAIRQFSHLPTIFYQWGECVRVFVFKSSSVQTAPYLIWEHGFRIRYVVFMIEEIVVEYRFQKVVQSKGSHILSWKCGRVMWEHKCRIHHIFFMSEESVLEYRF